MAGTIAPLPAAPVRIALPVLLAACGVASVFVVGDLPGAGGAPTTYAAVSTGAVTADLAAGLGLLVAGGLAFLARPGAVGPLAALAGVAWLADDWIGWEAGPSLARSAAMVAAAFLLAFVVHLAAAFPSGHVAGRTALVLVAVAYGATTVASVGRAVLRDPFLDQYCWSNCTDNDFLVDANPDMARLLTDAWLRSTVVIGLALTALCAWRLVRVTPVARATLAYVLAPAALVGAAEAAYAALLIHDPVENPQRAPFVGVFFARAGALTALALGVIWSVLRAWRARRTVARLAGELGETPAPGAFRSLLARSLGDDRLDVAYWITSAGRYVDDGGHAVSPAPGPEQAATAVVRGGEPVALVVHDRALQAQHDLDREIGAAARLAVDNERLRAETLVQLERLRASRARVVAMADTTRRQLERDLHDGAQQTLLAVLYELRLAHAAAVTAGNLDLAKALAQGSREAEQGLDDLRELAHGIFPAILTEAGLGPALWTLADEAPIPMEIDEVVEARYPAGAETAAYLVVRDAVDDAATRAATHVVARVDAAADRLVVEVRDDGGARSSDSLVHLADRVGALGGRMDVHGPRVRAEIPCA